MWTGVQAWCKLPIRLNATQIDSYAVSGHKIHAHKGVGALYLRKGYHVEKFLYGGHQEQGAAPGNRKHGLYRGFGLRGGANAGRPAAPGTG